MSVTNSLKRVNTQQLSLQISKRPDFQAATSWPENICTRCYKVTRKVFTNGQPTSLYGRFVAEITESHEELRLSSCPICQAIALIKPSLLDGKVCELTYHSAWATFGRASSFYEMNSLDATDCYIWNVTSTEMADRFSVINGFLAVIEEDFQGLDFGPREIDSKEIDFSLVKRWITSCESVHSRLTCKPDPPGELQNLRVIDCETRLVVSAPLDCHYLALSYVWGQVQANQGEDLPSLRFSLVVEDSISVTISLGFQYLWVDRHCIDQNDSQKHVQLGQMDKIYSCAQLTIVAAAGEDASYGLPGVSFRVRQSQVKLKVDGTTLLQIFPHPAPVIKRSTWSKRGWTYQEGYLSKRRLIFTDSQFSFLCNGAHVSESVGTLHYSLSHNDRTLFRDIIPSDARFLQHTKGLSYNYRFDDVSQLIFEYSSRKLTFENDVILALLGVFQVLERRGLFHLWGVPYESTARHNLRLDWRHDVPGTRRVNFPSWSWTGWIGSVRINGTNYDKPCFDVNLVSGKISIKTWEWNYPTMKWVMELPTLPKYRYVPPTDAPREINIEGLLLHLYLKQVRWNGLRKKKQTVLRHKVMTFLPHHKNYKIRRRNGLHAILPIAKNLVALAYVYLDDMNDSVSESTCGLVIQNHYGLGVIKAWHYIILLSAEGSTGNNVFRRIGILHVRHYPVSSQHWTHAENTPMGYTDSVGNWLDEIDSGAFVTRPRWLEKAERKNIIIV